ncbi:hypothetical protein [Oleiharenicola lentus]|uniref:hypothetical protein n=1 Tax=Oleiharenicola lentus TaxID=2508720 RepID=UPI003F6798E5
MKIIAQLAFRGALLALLALGFSSLTAKAQAVLEVQESARETNQVARLKLIAESPVPLAHETIDTCSPQKYLLHVSDRAQRGRVEPKEIRGESVLPELSDSVPTETRSQVIREEKTEPGE